MEILNQGFDHVEFVVNDVRAMGSTFEQLGFQKIGDRSLSSQGTKSVVYAQGFVRIVLTQPTGPVSSSSDNQPESLKFLNKHAEGICVLALEVRDATRAFEETTRRGARPAREPEIFKSAEG